MYMYMYFPNWWILPGNVHVQTLQFNPRAIQYMLSKLQNTSTKAANWQWRWEQNWRVPCSHWKNKFMMRRERGLLKNIQAARPAALYGEQRNKSLLIQWFTCNGQLHHDDWSSNPLSWQRCLFCVSVSVKLMHEWVLHVCCAYLQEHMTSHGFSKVIERVYVHKSKRKKGNTIHQRCVNVRHKIDSTREDSKYGRVTCTICVR